MRANAPGRHTTKGRQFSRGNDSDVAGVWPVVGRPVSHPDSVKCGSASRRGHGTAWGGASSSLRATTRNALRFYHVSLETSKPRQRTQTGEVPHVAGDQMRFHARPEVLPSPRTDPSSGATSPLDVWGKSFRVVSRTTNLFTLEIDLPSGCAVRTASLDATSADAVGDAHFGLATGGLSLDLANVGGALTGTISGSGWGVRVHHLRIEGPQRRSGHNRRLHG